MSKQGELVFNVGAEKEKNKIDVPKKRKKLRLFGVRTP